MRLKLVAASILLLLLIPCFVVPSLASSSLSLSSPNAQAGGLFGYSVAISGVFAVVGTYSEAAGGFTAAGHAYVFNAKTGALVHTLTSPNEQVDGIFGYSVAISGSLAIVGAWGETAGGYSQAGHAYVFNAETGVLVQTLTSPNAQVGGRFGYSVAISGGLAVVGTYYEAAGGFTAAGHAYVFNAKTGALVQTLTSPNEQVSGFFGLSVAISKGLAVVGAYSEAAGGYLGAGHAYVFNAKTGALVQTLTSPNEQVSGFFGLSVAISGSLAVVGAEGETAGGYPSAGIAYAFNAKTGALVQTLTSPNAQDAGFFGASVAISGKLAVVGASYEAAGGYSEVGNAYVFNAKSGALVQTPTSPNAQHDGGFGHSVAISGTHAIVGAQGETAGGYYLAGHAYVFNTNTGALVQTLTSSNAQEYGTFGASVAISGKLAVVGAFYETAGGYPSAGHAYVFNANTGALVHTLTSPNAQVDGEFGVSVAISGSLAVVGAQYEAAGGYPSAGHAYIFNAKTGALVQTLTSPNVQDGGLFGYSVAISGSLAIVGAYNEAAGGYSEVGHAYVFNANTGALVQTLTSSNAQEYGAFGASVAISGSLAVVGAYYETAGGYTWAGHAYIFNAKTGALVQALTSPNAQKYGVFGVSVAISSSFAVVGAQYEAAGGYSDAGHAYIFNANTGALIRTLTNPNAQDGGAFGASVAISGKLAMVGAWGETAGGHTGAGHAYVFNANTGALVHTLTSPNAQVDGAFGASVAISGSLAVVGAYNEVAGGYTGAGHAYTYSKGWLSS